MVKNSFRVNYVRTNINNREILIINGCFLKGKPEDNEITVLVNGNKADVVVDVKEDYRVSNQYVAESDKIVTEYDMSLDTTKYDKLESLVVMNNEGNGEVQKCVEIKEAKLNQILNKLNYHLDYVEKREDMLHISGWVIYKYAIDIAILDQDNNLIASEIKFSKRSDVEYAFSELEKSDRKYGFSIKVPAIKNGKISFKADGFEYITNLPSTNKSVISKLKIDKLIRYYRQHGMKMTCKRVVKGVVNTTRRVFGVKSENYKEWIEKIEKPQLAREKCDMATFKKNIKFSIVIPLYNTNTQFFNDLLASIENQMYTNYEICFADGSDKVDIYSLISNSNIRDKIVYKKLAKNDGISENTNRALELATGDYIVLADHDDLLAPNALYELAKVINENYDADVIYSDEDKISMDGSERFDPHFKPDFNIDLLTSVNYICHLFAVSSKLVKKIGNFNKEYDGAQDYDFILRCVEKARNVYHIPKILYHWRCHKNSTAANPESKLYAFEAGRKAIEAHFERVGIEAVVTNGPLYGLYHSKLLVKGNPKVSILIPNKDHIDDLEKCISSIMEKTLYRNFEIIIIENNSVDNQTFEYYNYIQEQYDIIKVVTWDKEFNYSLINNYGAKFAEGEYLLLLNNDTEVINGDWLDEMLGYCIREDVGIVGARLLYPDDTVQHAGVIVGLGGVAGHAFTGIRKDDFGYFGRARCVQDYSAVTAACLMTKASIFNEVNGLTAELRVAFNDIDYCMKVRKENYLVVYNPYIELYHYESKSRGLEDTPEKIERFNSEIDYFKEKWNDELEKGDPYYNPNLTLDRHDFSLHM